MYTAEFWWSGGPASGEDGGGETAWQNLLRDNGEFLRRVFRRAVPGVPGD
jgi:hypothetical protein